MARCNSVLLAGLWASLSSASVLAQVPPGATPGGALPRVEPAVRAAKPAGELFTIPRVYDRPLGLDEGPRIVVKAFKISGAIDRPAQGVRVAEIAALLESARAAQPAAGFSINQMQEVAGKVATYYREHGYILAQAFVPAQDVAGGEVVVQVLEGRLAGVVVEGNKRYSARVLQRPFQSLLGAPIDKDTIESALLTLTNYPGITAFGVLGAGNEVGTSRLTLRVQSEDRFRVEAALDNYGSQFAGEYRGTATFTFNDPLGRADRLQLVGLYAVDSGGSSTHGAYGGVDYEIPLFSPRDSLRFLHLTNAYTIGGDAAGIATTDTEGKTQVDEIGYRHDFARTRLGSASIGLAFNIKRAEFEAPPTAIFDDKLTTARLDMQWERIDTRFRGVNRVAFSYTRGFDDLLDSLGEYDPAAIGGASRLGASGAFDKISLQLQRLQRLTASTSIVLRLEGQYSQDPLVSLEQFSLGGPNSVRAYAVSEVLAEKGGVATLELISGAPGFANRPAFSGYTWGQMLQLSLFVDYAHGELNEPLLPGQEQSVNLSGAGVALQFTVPGRIFARLDVATPISDRPVGNGRDPQVYCRFGTSF
jgi:hemolysin activation/secretion protein